ncbi:MAG: VWA domain-containing protein [bacterium]|nr:VWA domain-containing protein [bacterium]
MTLRFLWEPWLLAVVGLPLLAVCIHALVRSRRDDDGTQVAWWRRLAMVVAVLLIGATPAIPGEADEVTSNLEVYIVVDRTGSMAAEDFDGSQPRLEGVRHDLRELIAAFPGSRYSIIAWDSTASRQLPLTTDARAVETWAQTLAQENSNYSAGSAIDRPLFTLTRTLERGIEQHPENVRLVFFLSDGENTDGDDSSVDASPDGYADLRPYVDGGAVLGYGTTTGGQMKVSDWSGVGDDYITDYSTGQPAISRINEANLRALADNLGVPYEHRTAPTSLAGLASGIDVEAKRMDGRAETSALRDVTWPLAWIVAGLLAWEAYEQLRRLRLLGGSHAQRT